MNQLFNPDSPVLGFITKIVYCVYLNILWLVCSLPIVTIGASTTALFYVTLKMAKNEEGNITRAFFHSFKENFRQGTVIWMILLVLGTVLGIDGYVLYHMRFENAFWAICSAVFIVVLAAYAIVVMYIFPLLSRFDNTVAAMFKNSIMLGMRFLLCTVLMAVIYFVMAFVIINIFTPAVIFGEGLCAFLCSCLLSNILLMCQEKAENTPEASEDTEEELS
ncbi:MAG: YesL family protein [Lachnospiraceae bacterium]|nr:YesL family protein [Lachnospiraceae bacterium]